MRLMQKGQTKEEITSSKESQLSELPLERLHMDLFGPVKCKSVVGDQYCLVVTDDYSRFSWVMCMAHKSETFDNLMMLFSKLESIYNLKVKKIRT